MLEQPFEGILNNLERRFRETQSDAARKELEECMATAPCPQCHGDRLKSEIARAVTVGGIEHHRLLPHDRHATRWNFMK